MAGGCPRGGTAPARPPGPPGPLPGLAPSGKNVTSSRGHTDCLPEPSSAAPGTAHLEPPARIRVDGGNRRHAVEGGPAGRALPAAAAARARARAGGRMGRAPAGWQDGGWGGSVGGSAARRSRSSLVGAQRRTGTRPGFAIKRPSLPLPPLRPACSRPPALQSSVLAPWPLCPPRGSGPAGPLPLSTFILPARSQRFRLDISALFRPPFSSLAPLLAASRSLISPFCLSLLWAGGTLGERGGSPHLKSRTASPQARWKKWGQIRRWASSTKTPDGAEGMLSRHTGHSAGAEGGGKEGRGPRR